MAERRAAGEDAQREEQERHQGLEPAYAVEASCGRESRALRGHGQRGTEAEFTVKHRRASSEVYLVDRPASPGGHVAATGAAGGGGTTGAGRVTTIGAATGATGAGGVRSAFSRRVPRRARRGRWCAARGCTRGGAPGAAAVAATFARAPAVRRARRRAERGPPDAWTGGNLQQARPDRQRRSCTSGAARVCGGAAARLRPRVKGETLPHVLQGEHSRA